MTALEQQRELLQPAPVKAFMVAIDRLTTFAATFGITVANPKAAAEFYREDLGDLPADLLDKAVRSATKNWIYQSLPKPAEVRKHVVDELIKRRTDATRLEMAHMRAPAALPKPGTMSFDVRKAVNRLADATAPERAP